MRKLNSKLGMRTVGNVLIMCGFFCHHMRTVVAKEMEKVKMLQKHMDPEKTQKLLKM